ncbi:MAG: hypothetical protein WDM92_11450 [Caulobacteraceae bacterium]
MADGPELEAFRAALAAARRGEAVEPFDHHASRPDGDTPRLRNHHHRRAGRRRPLHRVRRLARRQRHPRPEMMRHQRLAQMVRNTRLSPSPVAMFDNLGRCCAASPAWEQIPASSGATTSG